MGTDSPEAQVEASAPDSTERSRIDQVGASLWSRFWAPLAGLADLVDGWWNRRVGRCPKGPSRDVFVSLAVVMYLVLNAARTSLDEAVKRINPAGEDGVGVNSLHDGTKAVEKAFDVWARGSERVRLFVDTDPVSIATLQTAFELVMIPFTVGLLFGIASHLRTRFNGEPGRDVMTAAMLGVLGYGLLGVFNQVAELWILIARDAVPVITPALEVTGPLRRLLLLLVFVPLIAGVVRLNLAQPRDKRMRWWRGAPTYRIMIIVVALHAALLLVSVPGNQSADAMRLWEVRPILGFWGILATAALSVSVALYSTRMGSRVVPVRLVLGRTKTRVILAAGVVILGAGALAWWQSWSWAPVTLAIGAIAVGLGALSLPLIGDREAPRVLLDDVDETTKETVPAVLATAPFASLAVALIHATVPTMLDRADVVEKQTHAHLIYWVVLAAVLAIGAFPVVRMLAANEIDRRKEDRDHRRDALAETDPSSQRGENEHDDRFRRYAVAAALPSVIVSLWIVGDPIERAPDFGVVTIMSIGLVIVVTVFGALAVGLDGQALPAALDFIGLKRVPIVTGLIVVAVLSQQFAPEGYHDVSTTAGLERPAVSQLTIDAALDDWLAQHATDVESTDGDERPAVPLVFVTAAGGGIKAAAFTATVLDCIFDPVESDADVEVCAETSTWDQVFVASGASGGSVGIASVLAETADREGTDDWVAERLGGDLLSASLAWQLLVEAPNAVAAFHPDRDRAAILEEVWRRQFDLDATSMPFYRDRSGDGWEGPLPFFSGTNLIDGCRVNVSPVRAGVAGPDLFDSVPIITTRSEPCSARRIMSDQGRDQLPDQGDTRDLTDYLCGGANVDLATAAFLSARFPYVSPTGTLRCAGDEIAVGDGGYRDNSGASTVDELWQVIEPLVADHNRTAPTCVVPIVLEINSGYAGLQAPQQGSSAAQLIAPALGAKAVFGDLSFGAVEQVAAEFSRPLAPDLRATFSDEPLSRHFRVSLVAHPGVTAPLGWSLSEEAVDDFEQQILTPENSRVIRDLTSILESPDELRCRSTG